MDKKELDKILISHRLWLTSDRKQGARADLRGADLRGANLRGANLRGADLREANLQGANLRGANLRGANLRGAFLWGTDLREANLQGANLREADLQGANLQGANLREADLRGASLRGTYLQGADLEPIKKDLFDVLLRAIPEIPLLKNTIINGKIDGSTYEGECACLCGTIEKSERFGGKCDMRDSSRPIERFFLCIVEGDKPENSYYAKLALEWIEEFEQFLSVK